jgi:transposase
MKRCHFIGADVHCQFSEVAAVNQTGRQVYQGQCSTTIPALVQELLKIPRPRQLAIEEGPLADWLWRNLRTEVDDMVICNPRRNHLIAAEGDKDDPIDALKLAQLYRGGYIKAVHHAESLDRALLKQQVALYHDRVRHRVSEGQRALSLLRRHGVFVREKAFVNEADRPVLLERLPNQPLLREAVQLLWQGYDAAVAQEEWMRRRLIQLAKNEEVVCRFTALPGISWIRAVTLFVWLDTPWRFRSKSALWKYLGIGLERRHSGTGVEHLRVPWIVNRQLKSTILGAARSAAAQGDNPFADVYGRWMADGLSPQLARRNVARALSATLWGLWKNGSAYCPKWVGVAGAASNAAEVST